ncbi:hypothetical protein WA158_005697 [Blastocystis sp. Blastoise]
MTEINMSENGWFYRSENSDIGPLPFNEMSDKLKEGIISENTIIWTFSDGIRNYAKYFDVMNSILKEKDNLPSPWSKLHSTKGYEYYYNRDTKQITFMNPISTNRRSSQLYWLRQDQNKWIKTSLVSARGNSYILQDATHKQYWVSPESLLDAVPSFVGMTTLMPVVQLSLDYTCGDICPDGGTPASVLYNLKKRYEDGLPYTQIGSNNHNYIYIGDTHEEDLYSETYMNQYYTCHNAFPPHLYELLTSSLQSLEATGTSQTVLLIGQEGTPKTRLFTLSAEFILKMCQGDSNLRDKILSSLMVLKDHLAVTYPEEETEEGYMNTKLFLEGNTITGAQLNLTTNYFDYIWNRKSTESCFNIYYYAYFYLYDYQVNHGKGPLPAGFGEKGFMDFQYLFISNLSNSFLEKLKDQYISFLSYLIALEWTDEDLYTYFLYIYITAIIGEIDIAKKDDHIVITNRGRIDALYTNTCIPSTIDLHLKAIYALITRQSTIKEAQTCRNQLATELYSYCCRYLIERLNKDIAPPQEHTFISLFICPPFEDKGNNEDYETLVDTLLHVINTNNPLPLYSDNQDLPNTDIITVPHTPAPLLYRLSDLRMKRPTDLLSILDTYLTCGLFSQFPLYVYNPPQTPLCLSQTLQFLFDTCGNPRIIYALSPHSRGSTGFDEKHVTDQMNVYDLWRYMETINKEYIYTYTLEEFINKYKCLLSLSSTSYDDTSLFSTISSLYQSSFYSVPSPVTLANNTVYLTNKENMYLEVLRENSITSHVITIQKYMKRYLCRYIIKIKTLTEQMANSIQFQDSLTLSASLQSLTSLSSTCSSLLSIDLSPLLLRYTSILDILQKQGDINQTIYKALHADMLQKFDDIVKLIQTYEPYYPYMPIIVQKHFLQLKEKKEKYIQALIGNNMEIAMSSHSLSAISTAIAEGRIVDHRGDKELEALSMFDSLVKTKIELQSKGEIEQYRKICYEIYIRDKIINKNPSIYDFQQYERLIRGKPSLYEYSKSDMKSSLTSLPPSLISISKDIFKAIREYMKDIVCVAPPVSVIYSIIVYSLSISPDQLIPETYCLLLKQLRNNPNGNSTDKGWELLFVLLHFLVPPEGFLPFLIQFIYTNAKIPKKFLSILNQSLYVHSFLPPSSPHALQLYISNYTAPYRPTRLSLNLQALNMSDRTAFADTYLSPSSLPTYNEFVDSSSREQRRIANLIRSVPSPHPQPESNHGRLRHNTSLYGTLFPVRETLVHLLPEEEDEFSSVREIPENDEELFEYGDDVEQEYIQDII